MVDPTRQELDRMLEDELSTELNQDMAEIYERMQDDDREAREELWG